MSELELARREYDDYIHGNGYAKDKEGAYKHIDLLATPLDYDMDLYRGSTTAELDAMMKSLGLSGKDYHKLEGKTLTDKMAKSTSTKKQEASDFYERVLEYNDYLREEGYEPETGVLFHYYAPKGTKTINRRAQGFKTDGFAANNEHTILPHNTDYRITYIEERKVWGKEKVLDVYVDLVNKKKK